MFTNLKPLPGELRATVHITRAATGEVETTEVIGHADPAMLEFIQENRRREAAGDESLPAHLFLPTD